MNAMPLISIVLPVFNSESTVAKALESVLSQTYQNLEILCLDDGSTDGSADVLATFKDSRLRIIKNEKNLGLIRTLNNGIHHATGEFVARMDADDIAHPERLAVQLSCFEKNPRLAVVGSAVRIINSKGLHTGEFYPAWSGSDFLRWKILAGTIIHHPTALIRRSVLSQDSYDPRDVHCEDYGLWLRLSKNWDLDNVTQPLLDYRVHPTSVSQKNKEHQVVGTVAVLDRHLRENYGIEFTQEALRAWAQPRYPAEAPTYRDFAKILTWMHPSNPAFSFSSPAQLRLARKHYYRRIGLIMKSAALNAPLLVVSTSAFLRSVIERALLRRGSLS